jgi:transposase
VSIIGGLDVHRRQITYDWIDIETGQQRQGRLAPAGREHLRGWLEQFAGQQAAFALESCTGWRYVVEELQQAGITAHLAEPADTRALWGRKRHAKTDRADARHLRELLIGGRLPESWIPPAHVLEARTQVRLSKALVDQRTAWQQRIHAVLFHALCGLYGVGPITAVAIWAELGDARRFSSSRHAVRHTGLDVTVYASDDQRAPAIWPVRARAYCVGRCSRRPSVPPGPARPTTPTTPRSRHAWAATGRR